MQIIFNVLTQYSQIKLNLHSSGNAGIDPDCLLEMMLRTVLNKNGFNMGNFNYIPNGQVEETIMESLNTQIRNQLCGTPVGARNYLSNYALGTYLLTVFY